jgi:hypothetical protein
VRVGELPRRVERRVSGGATVRRGIPDVARPALDERLRDRHEHLDHVDFPCAQRRGVLGHRT